MSNFSDKESLLSQLLYLALTYCEKILEENTILSLFLLFVFHQRVKVAVLKSFGVTGGADAKHLDENKRAQVKGKIIVYQFLLRRLSKVNNKLIYCDFVPL